MKFRIKDCKDCRFWQELNDKDRKVLCYYHECQDYQPPALIKAIKREKRERKIARILFLLIFLPILILLMVSLGDLYFFAKLSIVSKIIILFQLISALILSIILFQKIKIFEKRVRSEIKDYQKQLAEWIIEYA